jgi:hypothetical protein
MTTPEHEGIIQVPVPAQPLRRRRLGEPTVRIELVVINSNGQFGKKLLRRQAAVVKEALQWFAAHPPTDEPNQDDSETEATQTRRELLRGQRVPAFDRHRGAFPQVR